MQKDIVNLDHLNANSNMWPTSDCLASVLLIYSNLQELDHVPFLSCNWFLICSVCHLPNSCRHTIISKFFGDKSPNCAGACDYCRNPKAVRAQLERAAALSTKTEKSKEATGPFGFQQGLYEGGKKGYGFERQDNFSCIPEMLIFGLIQCNIKVMMNLSD